MVRITMDVDGMSCGMCEAHVNDALRRTFPVKKVTSSHAKGRVELLAEEPPDEEKLRAVLAGAGCTVPAVRTEPWEKKGFPFFRT